ncbi:MAG: DNA topoisomerase 3 [Ottowia sp.]|nr:DNA topoisomerase 3 [Ottowia sp.]
MAKDIAEAIDPNARRAEGYFIAGQDRVTYCVGHLIEQCKPEEYDPALKAWDLGSLPFVPNEWRMRPRSLKNNKGQDIKKDGKIQLDQKIVQQIAVIKKLVHEASEVINAGDADREGQLIIDEVLRFVGCQAPVWRLWLQELNVPGIRKALGRMKDNTEYLPLSLSALARSQADFLIGMNSTRGYTKLWQAAGNDGMLHVGRVQTPTLWLVYEREQQRKNFKSVEHFGVKVDLDHANGTFAAFWVPPDKAPFLDEEGRVLSKAEAQRVIDAVKGQTGSVTSTKTEGKRQNQPLPYTLLDIQKAANKFGYKPLTTLEVVQSLYEKHKIVSYPRTDCPYLPEEDHSNAASVLAAVKANYGADWQFPGTPDLSIKSPAWNDKKLGAHFGLVPTIGRKPVGELTASEKLIYGLIVRRYLAQFYPVHEFEATIVLLDIASHQFKANGKVVTQKGWKVLYEAAGTGGDDDSKTPSLPKVQQGDSVSVQQASLQTKKTEPPPLHDGESLLDAMKNVHRYVTDAAVKSRLKEVEGLGTEATRAGIIENLIAHNYIKEVPKKGAKVKGVVEYVTTEHGCALLQVVSAELSKPDLTAWFEGKLEEIKEGQMEFARFSTIAEKFIRKIVDEIKSPEQSGRIPKVASANSKPCPTCGGVLTVREKRESKEKFWGCRKYPECRHTEPYVEPPKPGKSGPASFRGKPRASKPATPARSGSPSNRKAESSSSDLPI